MKNHAGIKPDLPAQLLGSVYHEDLHGAQRMCYLLLRLLSGERLSVQEEAERLGMTRANIYRMLRELSDMHIPVVNQPWGTWTLLEFLSEDDEPPAPKPRRKRKVSDE
jgi:hypothetical protein